MICTSVARVLGGTFDCMGSPAALWGEIALALTISASAALCLRAGSSRGAKFAVPVLFSLAALMLAIALDRPVLRQSPEPSIAGGHMVVLIDRSESFWRDPAIARSAVSQAADRIDGFVTEMSLQEGDAWRGEIFGFGLAAGREGAETRLANLPGAVRPYRPTAPEGASNLGAGMLAALGRLADLPGRRILVLVTDGQTADAPDADLLAQFRAAGIEIHTLGAGSAAPMAGLIAADVGPEHDLGQLVVLRGTVLGGGTLVLSSVDGPKSPQSVPDADQLRAFRLETILRQRGLQGITLQFDTDAGRQGRTLFTLVRGPARVLVFGPALWADSLPAARWQIERADPDHPLDPASFDLVVVDGLSPVVFPADYPARLLAAAGGTGLLVINGPLRGTVDQEQVISDWNGTVLSPILPVDSDPRLYVQEPPPRDIVIMVDVSGSMQGMRLGSAQSAINAILDQLRPQDSVTILPFADGGVRSFAQAPASAATVAAARWFTAGLSAGGGTAPDSTITDSARFASNYCAFFFISDADFAPPATAPRCFTTAISVSNDRFPTNVANWGEELLIGEGGDGRNIRLRYFEPDEREEYFRPGSFRPQVAEQDLLPDAGVDVEGLAISYARVDARIGLVHSDPPPDPLFVWRRDVRRSGVVTGAFLGPMGVDWGDQGLQATERMLGMLLGWSDQDRYLIRLTDSAGVYRLNVTELQGQSTPGMMSASLLDPNGSGRSLPLQFDPRLGAHTGTFRLPAVSGRQRLLLALQQGNDVQRIPITVPEGVSAQGGGREAFDFGVNRALISEINMSTQGNDLAQGEIGFYASPEVARITPIHPFFLVVALMLLAAAVWAREIGRL